ncbi:MAG: zinc-ribbon domain containing protein [Firmicutes bacterium]|nr:zinc-ribbon domain containing protein [Bacillota bacterium]
MYRDKTLICKDCGSDFAFTASEQAFFASKGFTNDPGRCPECRAAKKHQNGGRGGPGNSGGGHNRQMYSAVCGACGASATVPFQPNGEKPVYCRDCFKARRQY